MRARRQHAPSARRRDQFQANVAETQDDASPGEGVVDARPSEGCLVPLRGVLRVSDQDGHARQLPPASYVCLVRPESLRGVEARLVTPFPFHQDGHRRQDWT